MPRIPQYVASRQVDSGHATLPRILGEERVRAPGGNPAAGLGQLRVRHEGQPALQYDDREGAALRGLGAAIEQSGQVIGNMATRLQEEEQRADRFEWSQKYQQFAQERDQDITSAKDNMQPGARGFTEGLLKSYDERAKEFLKDVPEHLKDQVPIQVQTLRGNFVNKASSIESGERRRWYVDGVERSVDRLRESVTNDPASLPSARETARGLLDEADIPPVDKEGLRRKHDLNLSGAAIDGLVRTERYDEARALAKSVAFPERQAVEFFTGRGYSREQAAGIVGHLVQESGLDPNARNPGDGRDGSDSIGLGQWNGARAKALVRFAAERGRPVNDFQTQLEFIDHELKGSEGRAGAALKSAKTVDEATAAFMGYERPKGWTADNPTGGHGWDNRLAHAKRLSLGDVGFDERKALVDRTETRITQEQNRRQVENRTEASALTVRLSDSLASMERTGQGVPDIDRGRVEKLLGTERWTEYQDRLGRSERVYTATQGIEQLPEGDIERRLQALEPKPGADGFLADIETYDRARKKVDKVLESRRADPALAVEALPVVREARASAVYEGEGEARRIRSDSAQAIVKARLAAQEQVGIAEPMAVTRSEARVIGRQLRYIGDDDNRGMEVFLRSLRATYGDYTDAVLTATLQHAGLNRELSVLAKDVLTKISRGPTPDISSVRRMDAHLAWSQPVAGDSALAGMAMSPVDEWSGGLATSVGSAPEKVEGPSGVTFDPRDLKLLSEDRSLATEFDIKYGGGAAERVLKEADRRKAAAEKTYRRER